MSVRVVVVGFGTIGKRVAYAVKAQDDMELVGVIKRRVDWKWLLHEKVLGARFYTSDRLEEVLREDPDVVIDATPKGVGVRNKEFYEEYGLRAIFQGGEPVEVAEASFVAQCN